MTIIQMDATRPDFPPWRTSLLAYLAMASMTIKQNQFRKNSIAAELGVCKGIKDQLGSNYLSDRPGFDGVVFPFSSTPVTIYLEVSRLNGSECIELEIQPGMPSRHHSMGNELLPGPQVTGQAELCLCNRLIRRIHPCFYIFLMAVCLVGIEPFGGIAMTAFTSDALR